MLSDGKNDESCTVILQKQNKGQYNKPVVGSKCFKDFLHISSDARYRRRDILKTLIRVFFRI